jgi:hypothetical protein
MRYDTMLMLSKTEPDDVSYPLIGLSMTANCSTIGT